MAAENLPVRSKDDVFRWRKPEIVGALIYLYHMIGHTYDPKEMPRGVLAEMLGVNRHRITRCLADARRSQSLAKLMYLKLGEHRQAKQVAMAEKRRAKPRPRRRQTDNRHRSGEFRTKGRRNRNLSMTPVTTL